MKGATAGRERSVTAVLPSQRDLFAELSPVDRHAFLARCKEHRFDKGAFLYAQSEPFTTAHLVRSGVVRIYYLSPKGREITTAYWSRGALVGGPNVFREGLPQIWSAQAETHVVTEAIRGRDLEDLSMKLPQLAHYLIESLMVKLRWTSVLLQAFGTDSVHSRLAHLLLHLSESDGVECDTGTLIAHMFSHDELARMVGATRPYVTTAIKNLKKEAAIVYHDRHIVVVDRTRLKRAAHG